MRKLLIMPLLFLSTLFISSCCGCRGAISENPYFLTSSTWQLVELDRTKFTPEEDSFTITFDEKENRAYGRGDCNNYFSTYSETDVRKLKFENGGATKMFCPNQENEDKYLSVLNGIDSYTIDGDMLLLQTNGEVKMIFQAIEKKK